MPNPTPSAARPWGRHSVPETVVVAAIATMLLAACSAAPASPSPATTQTTTTPSPSSIPRGGTVRIVAPTEASDTGELLGFDETAPGFLDVQVTGHRGDRELIRCCLGRTLFSYTGRPTEEGGARLQPDLAVAMPEVSADGLTWTVRIKPGIHYGPPLGQVEITAADFIRSLHRLFSPALASAPPWMSLQMVEGWEQYQAGRVDAISGLEAPDAHTLVIRLAEQEGDFASVLATPQTAPLPPDPFHPSAAFGIAQDADEGFGRFLVSSGPYMLEGSERLDFSVPAAHRAGASGLAKGRVTLVRNPSWDPASDPLRPAYADRIEITVAESMAAAVAAVENGSADLLWNPRGGPPSVSGLVYAAFQSDPSRGHAYVNAQAKVNVIALNLALPPFDDIHVRKALNWALDKHRLTDLLGGPSAAGTTGHIAPDSTEEGLLIDYDPYETPGDRGDLAAARAEMRLSKKYDTDGDGVCDAPVCAHLSAFARPGFDAVARAAAESYRPLGIGLDVQPLELDAFMAKVFDDPAAKVAMEVGLSWLEISYNGAAWAFLPWYHAPTPEGLAQGEHVIIPLVGATSKELQAWGYGDVEVPNVDSRLDACWSMVGTTQTRCWVSFDQYAMENALGLIPYSQNRFTAVASPRVVAYGFDELVGDDGTRPVGGTAVAQRSRPRLARQALCS